MKILYKALNWNIEAKYVVIFIVFDQKDFNDVFNEKL